MFVIGFGFTFDVGSIYWNIVQHYYRNYFSIGLLTIRINVSCLPKTSPYIIRHLDIPSLSWELTRFLNNFWAKLKINLIGSQLSVSRFHCKKRQKDAIIRYIPAVYIPHSNMKNKEVILTLYLVDLRITYHSLVVQKSFCMMLICHATRLMH